MSIVVGAIVLAVAKFKAHLHIVSEIACPGG